MVKWRWGKTERNRNKWIKPVKKKEKFWKVAVVEKEANSNKEEEGD